MDNTRPPLDSYELLMVLQQATVRTMIRNHGLDSDALIVELVLEQERVYERWLAGETDA